MRDRLNKCNIIQKMHWRCILTHICLVPIDVRGIKGVTFHIQERSRAPILHLDRKRTILFSTRTPEKRGEKMHLKEVIKASVRLDLIWA